MDDEKLVTVSGESAADGVAPAKVRETRCGCTVEMGSGKRHYCSRHEPGNTAKGQAMAAMERAVALLKSGSVTALDAVQLKGLVEYAMERVGAIEELKKARPVKR